MRSYPDLKIAFSEGGIGWIPFYLDRCDRHYTNQKWLRRDFGGQAAERGLPRALPGLLRDRSVGTEAARPDRHRHHRLGVRLPPFRLDLAGCPRAGPRRARAVGASDPEIDKITWENSCPLLQLGPVHGDAARPGHGRGAPGSGAPTSTRRSGRARSGPRATPSATPARLIARRSRARYDDPPKHDSLRSRATFLTSGYLVGRDLRADRCRPCRTKGCPSGTGQDVRSRSGKPRRPAHGAARSRLAGERRFELGFRVRAARRPLPGGGR